MMKIMLANALLIQILCALVPGLQQANTEYKTGERVEIFISEYRSIKGIVIKDLKDKIILDISLDYPELKDASATFGKDMVKEIRPIPPLGHKELSSIYQQRQEIEKKRKSGLRQYLADVEARIKEEEKRREEEEKIQKQEEEKILQAAKQAEEERALKIYADFPEDQGWGEEKYYNLQQRQRNFLPLTQQERSFLDNYPLWQKGKELYQKQKETTK